MKKLLAILVSFLIISCSESVSKVPDPSGTALLYVEASAASDFGSMYELLSTEDKDYLSREDYIEFKLPKNSLFSDVRGELQEITKAYASLTELTIKDKVINNDSATIVINISSPDYSGYLAEIFQESFSLAFSGEEFDQDKTLEELSSKKDVPRKITEETVRLRLEENKWKIYENVSTSFEKAKLDEKVDELLSKAKELQENKKYTESINNYTQVLNIDDSNNKAKSAINEIENELEEQAIKQEYIKNIEIFELEIKRIDTYLDKNVPAVKFAVKNNGDRSLDKVEVTVYFYDWDDKPIFEKKYLPVLVSDYSISNNDPLKPNYIRRKNKNEYYTVDQLGPEWSGKANAVVSDIRFSVE
tara:strand:- start:10 stop:1089 length:1080 start_codon:yes stop_codon:yes gene_type:complete